jgi:hypothetical protein
MDQTLGAAIVVSPHRSIPPGDTTPPPARPGPAARPPPECRHPCRPARRGLVPRLQPAPDRPGRRARPARRPRRSEGRRPAGHAATATGGPHGGLRGDRHRLGIESNACDGPPGRPPTTTPTAAAGRPVRRDAELLEHDLGDDVAFATVRGSSKPRVSGHRVIITNSLGRTCGRQRPLTREDVAGW